jgi:hypothetical protein
MRCVCARIRTSFSCISICNLSARSEKAPVLRRLFFPEIGRGTTQDAPKVSVRRDTSGLDSSVRDGSFPGVASNAPPTAGVALLLIPPTTQSSFLRSSRE